MIPDIEFHRPKTLKEALGLLASGNGSAKLLAGGTDILPGFQQQAPRFQNVERLIDIHRLKELKGIKKEENKVVIGGASTFSEISQSNIIQKEHPLLAKAVKTIGSVQIRNRATLGGNFVNNAPCADSVPPLLVYDAIVRIQSQKKIREVPLQELLSKPYKVQLETDEIVTSVVLPPIPEDLRGTFYKLGRRRGVAISRITLAILIKFQTTKIRDMRIACGAVTPIGIRFPELEQEAQGLDATSENFKYLAQQLGEKVLEVTGLRWSGPYKLPVVQQMCYQIIEQIYRDYRE